MNFKDYIDLKRSIVEEADHPMIEHNGKMVHVNNSEGKLIHHTKEGIKNFHDWFGDSKTVDEHGRPQVMYHGTGANIKQFEHQGSRMREGKLGKGIYLTPSTQKANMFAKLRSKDGNSNVMPVYANIKNPLVIHGENNRPVSGISREKIQANGNDGVVLKDDHGENTHELVAFHPSQIKSALGNSGDFSTKSNNITESE